MQAKLEEIVRAFGADLGTIHRLESEGLLTLRASIGVPPPVVKLIERVPVGKGMAGLAAERNEPVSSCNIQTDRTGNVRPGALATGANGALVVPIRDSAGKAVGALGIGVNRPYEYTAEETARLSVAAASLA